MSSSKQDLLRRIPAIDALLADAEWIQRTQRAPRQVAVDALRDAVEEVRKRLAFGRMDVDDDDGLRSSILDRAAENVAQSVGPHYRKVINATGIILHTALGRAVLPAAALRQIQDELSGYSLLQADIDSGSRAKRDGRIEWLLKRLTGAQAATVVNNNAAATMIALSTVAGEGGEIIVSRGQLVEIGGSFRLPDVIKASGATLVEVGSTNKTHAGDYQNAITENTVALLRVHPSNYKISGFTAEVPLDEMVSIAHDKNLPVIDDVGAGSLVDFSRFGFDPEPTLLDSIRAGADLVTASADKLIGGSQGGIILGTAELVERVRKNPLARVVRLGKLSLTALEATLVLFLDEATALREIPTLRMLQRPLSEITEQAARMARAINQRTSAAKVLAVDGFSQMGSGSLPTQDLATRLVSIRPSDGEPGELARRLRGRRTPVFTRVHKGHVHLDPRTVLDGEEGPLVEAVVEAIQQSHKKGVRLLF